VLASLYGVRYVKGMPRPPSENTIPVTLKLPDWLVELATEVTARLNDDAVGHVTRTDVMRYALIDGMERLAESKRVKSPRGRKASKPTVKS
jgi:hypothetical protein